MDKDFITKHNLMEAHKQFMRLSEGYLSTSLEEAGDDEENNQNPNDVPGMEGSDMPQGQDAPMPQGANGMTDMGNDMGGVDQPGQDPNAGPAMEGQPPMGGMEDQQSMGDMGTPLPMDDMGGQAKDDVVLDVDDITNAQEKLNKKENEIGKDVANVDDKILKLLTAFETIKNSIDKNNNDIAMLKGELEKRLPTDKEKLSMQSLRMYPFNVSPNKYWNDVEKKGVYDAQDGDDKKEYNIKEKDINDYSDSEIEKSFDDELHQTMKDIFAGF